MSEAVNDFIKKDMPVGDDQFIDVNLEDPKVSANQGSSGNNKSNSNNNNNDHDELDDLMFDMTTTNQR